MAQRDLPSPSDLPLSFGSSPVPGSQPARVAPHEQIEQGFGIVLPEVDPEATTRHIAGLPLVRALSGVREWAGRGHELDGGLPRDEQWLALAQSLGIEVPGGPGSVFAPALWLAAQEAGLIDVTEVLARPADRAWPPAPDGEGSLAALAADRTFMVMLGLAGQAGPGGEGPEMAALSEQDAGMLMEELGGVTGALVVLAARPEGVSVEGLTQSAPLPASLYPALREVLETLTANLVAAGLLAAADDGLLRIVPELQPALGGTYMAMGIDAQLPTGEEPVLRVVLAQLGPQEEADTLAGLPLVHAIAGIRNWVGTGRAIEGHLPTVEDLGEYCEALGIDVPVDEEGGVGALPVALWLTAAELGVIEFTQDEVSPGEAAWPPADADRLEVLRAAISAFAAAELQLITPLDEEELAQLSGEGEASDVNWPQDEDEMERAMALTGAYLPLLPLACRRGGVDIGALEPVGEGARQVPSPAELLAEPVADLHAAGLLEQDGAAWHVPDAVQEALGGYFEMIGVQVAR